MKYCQNCGEQIPSNDLFCPYCGAKQPTDPVQPSRTSSYQRPVYQQPPYTRSRNHHKLYMIIGIILVLIIGFIGYSHSTLSVNLQSELPNNTWTMSTTDNGPFHGKFTNVRFSNHSIEQAQNHKRNTHGHIWMKPTSRHTAKLFFALVKGGYTIYIPLTVKSGNENSFSLKPYGHVHILYEGKNYIVKGDKAISPYGNHVLGQAKSFSEMMAMHIHLTKK